MKQKEYKLQRFVVYVLRHNPKALSLVLDDNGFVYIDDLLKGLSKNHKYFWATKDSIYKIVKEQYDKKRLQIQGEKIGAAYGHSKRIIEKLEYEAKEPPEILYHGTPKANLEFIYKQGLISRSREYVDLSSTKDTEKKVGIRHSQDIRTLTVMSRKAWKSGIEFYHPEDQIWLVKNLPANFIRHESGE